MDWMKQRRVLELSGAALPKWHDTSLFTVSRLSGKEKLGHLYDYTVEVATIEDRMPGVREGHEDEEGQGETACCRGHAKAPVRGARCAVKTGRNPGSGRDIATAARC